MCGSVEGHFCVAQWKDNSVWLSRGTFLSGSVEGLLYFEDCNLIHISTDVHHHKSF